MSQYFPKWFRNFGGNINIKVDLSNYATEADIKNISHIDTSRLKTNWANLKTEVDKLNIDKLVPVPVDLSKLSNAVKMRLLRRLYDKLVAKVNNIDTSGFVLKTKYNTDKTESEKKFLILVILLKNEITMLKLVNLKIKYKLLVVWLQLLH